MPPTVHKVLIHGRQILEHSVLPPGCLAEEASEARNKIYKHDREFHARKDSRIHNLKDIFNRAMETSDPLISNANLRNRMEKQNLKQLKLPAEVLSLLCSLSASTEPETTPTTSTDEITNENEDFDEISDNNGDSDDNDDNEDTDDALPIFRHLNNFDLDMEEI